MTAAQDLVADPLTFLRDNLLRYAGPRDPQPHHLQANGTMLLALELKDPQNHPAARDRNRKGLPRLLKHLNLASRLGVSLTRGVNYYLARRATAADAPADTFPAYVCPYGENQGRSVFLGTDATLMFTVEMSGCSFGIGMPNGNGHVLVMHANDIDAGAQYGPRLQDTRQYTRLVSANVYQQALEPGDYRTHDGQTIDTRATVMGLWRQGRWEFWYQHFNSDPTSGDLHMLSVTRIG